MEEKETAAQVIPHTTSAHKEPEENLPGDENTPGAFLDIRPNKSTGNKGTQKGHRRPISRSKGTCSTLTYTFKFPLTGF